MMISLLDSNEPREHQSPAGSWEEMRRTMQVDQSIWLEHTINQFIENSGVNTSQQTAGQNPTFFHFSNGGLTAKPWWVIEEISMIFHCSRNALLEEFESLDFHCPNADSISTNCDNGRWAVQYVMESGKWNDSVYKHCPQLAAFLMQLPCCMSSLGHVYFSRISSGTHITPHYGCTNVKLRVQLPLYGCSEECTITVNGVSRSYVDGSPLIFDDSFVHEVRHQGVDGDALPRVVLVVDIWHPDLTPASIALLEHTFHPDRVFDFQSISNAKSRFLTTDAPIADPATTPAPVTKPLIIRLLPVGNHGVGKSAFIHRFANDTFTEPYFATIGMDFGLRTMTVDDILVKIQIWDVAGPERFRKITSAYYRGAHGIILMFCHNDRSSFDDLHMWCGEVKQYAPENVSMVLVGHKSDLQISDSEDPATFVSTEEAQALAAQLNVPYLECSAKTGENVEEVVTLLTSLAIKNLAANPVLRAKSTSSRCTVS